MLLEINADTPEPRKLQRAVDVLNDGGVIAYPPDTCYGIGCDLFNKNAIDRLYQIKAMDRDHMLSFVCPNMGDVPKYVYMHDHVNLIMKAYLPGTYYFILEATREVPRIVQSPRKTVRVRSPKHPVALGLTAALGHPIISSTAARSGKDPDPDPREIELAFPGLGLVLDAGAGGTVPTAVVDRTGAVPGSVRRGARGPEPCERG